VDLVRLKPQGSGDKKRRGSRQWTIGACVMAPSERTPANMNHSGLNFRVRALKGDALCQACLCLAHKQRRAVRSARLCFFVESGCVFDLL
jgi:hypothetical protein